MKRKTRYRYVNVRAQLERQAPTKSGPVTMTFTLIGEVATGNATTPFITAAFAAAIPCAALGHCFEVLPAQNLT